jgi:hypothetical protein
VWSSFGDLLEEKKDMVSCETNDRERREDLFEAAKHTKCASVFASPLLAIRWRDSDANPNA